MEVYHNTRDLRILDDVPCRNSGSASLVLRPKRLIPGEGRKRLEKTQAPAKT
jgi:hypothetical protein